MNALMPGTSSLFPASETGEPGQIRGWVSSAQQVR